MPRVNFNEVPDAANLSPVPPGRYSVVVVDATDGETRAGDPMITVVLEVVAPAEYVGRKVWDRLVFSTKALPRVKKFLSAAGYEGLDLGDVDVTAETVVGLVVDADLEISEFKGRDGETRRSNSVTFAGYGKTNEAVVDMNLAGKRVEAAQAAKAAAEEREAIADDDIPF
jgi:hypothetical protein